MNLDGILMSKNEFDYLIGKFCRLDKTQNEVFKIKFAITIGTNVYEQQPNISNLELKLKITEIFSSIHSMTNFQMMKFYADHSIITLRNLGYWNFMWLKEFRDYVSECSHAVSH